MQRQNKMICLFNQHLHGVYCVPGRHYSKHFTTWTHLTQGCFENKCAHPHFIDEATETQWDHKAIPGSLNPEFCGVYHRKNETWESTLLTNKLFFFFSGCYIPVLSLSLGVDDLISLQLECNIDNQFNSLIFQKRKLRWSVVMSWVESVRAGSWQPSTGPNLNSWLWVGWGRDPGRSEETRMCI